LDHLVYTTPLGGWSNIASLETVTTPLDTREHRQSWSIDEATTYTELITSGTRQQASEHLLTENGIKYAEKTAAGRRWANDRILGGQTRRRRSEIQTSYIGHMDAIFRPTVG